MKKFDYARDALTYLVQEYHIKELYIPYYLCDVIRHSLIKYDCKPVFYHIDNNFIPNIQFPKDKFILYPNYFGICSKNVDKLTKLYPKIIIDNAHSFYSQPSGFASFNCSRKFLSQNQGSFLWIGNGVNQYKPNFTRRNKFDEYNKKYSDTNNICINIKDTDIPFCYPYLASSVEEADELVKNLTAQGLVIYRYWKTLPKSFNEYKFYSRLVPIPLV